MNAEPDAFQATLVPVNDEGDFLLLGEIALPELKVLPVPYVRLGRTEASRQAVARSTGLANVGLQGAKGLQEVQGLVRLAPETIAALHSGATPLASGGWNLGTLQQNGKIIAQVRWAAAGSAGVVGVLAAAGPAVALLAVQWEVGKIARSVEKSIRLTSQVLDELRNESWHELHGAVRDVLLSVSHAIELGVVNEELWSHLQSQNAYRILIKQRSMHLEGLTERSEALTQSVNDKERWKWLETEYTELLRDARGVQESQQALLLYDAMRATRLRGTEDPANIHLAELVLKKGRESNKQTEQLVDTTLRRLHTTTSLLLDVDPTRTIGPRGSKVPLVTVHDAVLALHTQAVQASFGGLRPLRDSDPSVAATALGFTSADEKRSYQRRLGWLLRDDETVVMLVRGDAEFDGWHVPCLAALTDRRLLLINRPSLDRGLYDVRTVELGGARVSMHGSRRGYSRIRIESRSGVGMLVVRLDATRAIFYELRRATEPARELTEEPDEASDFWSDYWLT